MANSLFEHLMNRARFRALIYYGDSIPVWFLRSRLHSGRSSRYRATRESSEKPIHDVQMLTHIIVKHAKHSFPHSDLENCAAKSPKITLNTGHFIQYKFR